MSWREFIVIILCGILIGVIAGKEWGRYESREEENRLRSWNERLIQMLTPAPEVLRNKETKKQGG